MSLALRAPQAVADDLGEPFRRLWAAALLSNLGDGVRRVAVPLLGAHVTRDPFLIGMLSSAMFLPYLILGIPAGVIADRLARRTAMLAATTLRALSLAAVCLALVAGLTHFWLLILLCVLLGAAECVYDASADAAVPGLVPPALLDKANARLQGTITLANEFLGGPAGGILFAAGAVLPFAFEVAAALAVLALVVGMPRMAIPRAVPAQGPAAPRPARAPWGAVRADLLAGVSMLVRHRNLRGLAVISALCGLCLEVAQATMVLFALDVLGLPLAMFGVFAAASAVGALVGVAGVPRLIARFPRTQVMSGALLAQPLCLLALGLSPTALLAALSLGLLGASAAIWNVISLSTRQLLTPSEFYGRVHGAWRTMIWGGLPIGAALGGLIAGTYGLRAPWLVAAALFGFVAVAVLPIVRSVAAEAEGALARAT